MKKLVIFIREIKSSTFKVFFKNQKLTIDFHHYGKDTVKKSVKIHCGTHTQGMAPVDNILKYSLFFSVYSMFIKHFSLIMICRFNSVTALISVVKVGLFKHHLDVFN